MCSVTEQRSKQRRGVGWIVLLVGDELSLWSARRQLTRGVAPGRRQTVEAATSQTRRHGRRDRDVSDWSMATACWQTDGVSNVSEVTPRRCIVCTSAKRMVFARLLVRRRQYVRDLGSRTALSSRYCVELTTSTRPFQQLKNSLVNCFQRYLTSKQIDGLTRSVSDRISSSVDDRLARRSWSRSAAKVESRWGDVSGKTEIATQTGTSPSSQVEVHIRLVNNSPVQRPGVQVRWRHRLFR